MEGEAMAKEKETEMGMLKTSCPWAENSQLMAASEA
jgi:hypothetical protein